MSPFLLLRGGMLVSSTGCRRQDLLVEEDHVAAIGEELPTPPGCRVVDVGGAMLLPGGVDPHVHFHLETTSGGFSSDSFEEGSRAALLGATTTVIDFVTPKRGQALEDALEQRLADTVGARCDFGLHQSITSWDEHSAAEMVDMAENRGIPSFKVYTAYRDTIGIDDDLLLEVMKTAAEHDLLVLCHCEDGALIDYLRARFADSGRLTPEFHAASRPSEAEATAISKACAYAQSTGARLHVVHVSTADGAAAVSRARGRGAKITAEACTHHLLLDDSSYRKEAREAARFIMSPPLRPAADQRALWLALQQGVLDLVASDHCGFNLRGGKELRLGDFRSIPNGVAGVGFRTPLLYAHGVRTQRIGLWDWVALNSERAARIFGLYPRKGVLEPGSDADIVVWDAASTTTISRGSDPHACDNSPYDGFRLAGHAAQVYLRGALVVDEGRVLDSGPRGCFIPRALDSPR